MDRRLTGLDLKTSLSALADLAMPRECIVCGTALMPGERHICLCCRADLPRTDFRLLSRNPMSAKFNARIAASGDEGYVPYSYAIALYYYQAGYKEISQALKYRGNLAAGRYFASLLGDEILAAPHFSDVDLVLPVPLHWSRKWKRGYNQAELIAAEVARKAGVRCRTDVLVRCRRTRSQTRLSGDEKARNVSGAFRVARVPEAGHILLVDDVHTTGSTLFACYEALRGVMGPEVRISGATLAYVGD